jgi:3-oxoacyl-[acyl-carrier protein] reductase
MELGLKDKVAVVTGSSKGIGRAIAEALAHEGVHVVINGRNAKELEATATEMRVCSQFVTLELEDPNIRQSHFCRGPMQFHFPARRELEWLSMDRRVR